MTVGLLCRTKTGGVWRFIFVLGGCDCCSALKYLNMGKFNERKSGTTKTPKDSRSFVEACFPFSDSIFLFYEYHHIDQRSDIWL
jgi:hypothetical protein